MHPLNKALLVGVGVMLSRLVLADDVIPDRIDGGVNEPAVVWRAADTEALIEVLPPDILASLDDHDRVRRRHVKGSATQQADPCGGISFGPVQSEHFLPNDTLEDLVEASRQVYAGQVIARREGFFRGALVTMLAIRATGLKQDQGTGEIILVPYPRATIRINGSVYCSRIHGSDVEPAVDDRVIVFSYERGTGSSGTIITADAERELVIAGNHRGHLPQALQRHPRLEGGAGFDRIRESVIAAIRAPQNARGTMRNKVLDCVADLLDGPRR